MKLISIKILYIKNFSKFSSKESTNFLEFSIFNLITSSIPVLFVKCISQVS